MEVLNFRHTKYFKRVLILCTIPLTSTTKSRSMSWIQHDCRLRRLIQPKSQWRIAESVCFFTTLGFQTDLQHDHRSFSWSQQNVEELLKERTRESGCSSRVYCPGLSSCSRSELVLSTRLCGTVPASRVRAHIPSTVNAPLPRPPSCFIRYGLAVRLFIFIH